MLKEEQMEEEEEEHHRQVARSQGLCLEIDEDIPPPPASGDGDGHDHNHQPQQQSAWHPASSPSPLEAARLREKRCLSETNNNRRWFETHSKHLLICSWSGRPVFSRYGDESKLAAYMGVLSAIISNFQRNQDGLLSIRSGRRKRAFSNPNSNSASSSSSASGFVSSPLQPATEDNNKKKNGMKMYRQKQRIEMKNNMKKKKNETLFVFLLKGPLYLVVISSAGEPEQVLRRQLEYVHGQLMFILTAGVNQFLEAQPNYDLRSLLHGSEGLLVELIDQMSVDPAFLLGGIDCLEIAPNGREALSFAALKKQRSPGLLYAVLFAGQRLISRARAKSAKPLEPFDLLLLRNFVMNSPSLRDKESWTPICLPAFNDRGYLYAHVSFLEKDICMVLITVDPSEFHELKECKRIILEDIKDSQLFHTIQQSLEQQIPTPIAFTTKDMQLGEDVQDMRYFLYKSERTGQFVRPRPITPYTSREAQTAIFRICQRIHDRSCARKTHSIYFVNNDFATVLAWFGKGEFQMYAVFTPLVSKASAISACNKALQWIKRRESSLFALQPTTWG